MSKKTRQEKVVADAIHFRNLADAAEVHGFHAQERGDSSALRRWADIHWVARKEEQMCAEDVYQTRGG